MLHYLNTHPAHSAAALSLTLAIAQVDRVIKRADEYLAANAPLLLNSNRSKLIDLGVVALMEFETDTISWDHLRQIIIERLGVYEHGHIQWFIDIDLSTDRVLTISHENGRKLQYGLAALLSAIFINTH